MSLIIAVYVSEGIVLASDRRVTYTNTCEENGKTIERIGVHTTDSTDKTFLCPNGAGISTCGTASMMNKPITGFIREMIRTSITDETKTSEIPQLILDYFAKFENKPRTNFIVAGYEEVDGERHQLIYDVRLIPGAFDQIDTSHQCAVWNGEKDTLKRLFKTVKILESDGTEEILDDTVLWQYFTLQDAVDFARYAVETTIKTMHFKNLIEDVGGNVDILVITPEETKWLQKEELK